MSVRPWKRGTEAARAANQTVPAANEIGVADGNIYASDGTSKWSALKRLVRVDEVTTAVQTYVSGLVVTAQNLSALAAESGYVWAVVDQNGRVAWGVTPDGTTVAQKLSLAAGSIAADRLSSDTQLRLMQNLPFESGYAWAVVDQNGRAAILVGIDGSVSMPKFTLADGSISFAKLAAAVQGLLPSTLVAETGIAWALEDTTGRAAAGLKNSGEFFGRAYSPFDLTRTPAETTDYVVTGTLTSDYKHQLRVYRKSTKQWAVLSAGSDESIDPRFSADGAKVLYRSNLTGFQVTGPNKGAGIDATQTGKLYFPLAALPNPTWRSYYQNLPVVGDGVPSGMINCERCWVAWGDSLTNGTGGTLGNMRTFFADRAGLPIINGGIGGQTSIQIAARANGTKALITVTGNQIPASGSVAITAQSTAILGGSTTGFTYTIPGTLAGVHGVIQKDSAEAYTFIRDTAGSAVSCPPSSPFTTDLGETTRNCKQIFWLGRNNGGTTQARDDTIAIINHLTSLAPEYIVMTVINGANEPGATSGIVQTLNPALIAAFPNNYIDVRKGLVGGPDGLASQVLWPGGPALPSALAWNNLTPTGQDNTDTAMDTVPASLRFDSIHLDDYGYSYLGYVLDLFRQVKGF